MKRQYFLNLEGINGSKMDLTVNYSCPRCKADAL